MSQPAQPKIVQKRVVRTAIVLLIAATAFFLIRVIPDYLSRDDSPADTKGTILALKVGDGKSQAILVKADGSEIESPGFEPGTDDREAAWRPDGNRIFISRSKQTKDPEENNYQLYRWNPGTGKVERRTIGTRALAHPRFSPADAANPNAEALVTAGGKVLVFDPLKDGSTRQLLPPSKKEVQLDSKGSGENDDSGEFADLYRNLGTSFREARWNSDKSIAIAVMRRDNGEALIIQKLNGSPEERRPRLVAVGDKIEFDVSTKSDKVVYSILNFQWPDKDAIPEDFRKGGKVTRPFNHALILLNLATFESQPIDVSQNDTRSFGSVAISPDELHVLAVGGNYSNAPDFRSEALVMYTLQQGVQPNILSTGLIFDPCWHPGGKRVAFVKRNPAGAQPIYEMDIDGGVERLRSRESGSYAKPSYSPQGDKTQ